MSEFLSEVKIEKEEDKSSESLSLSLSTLTLPSYTEDTVQYACLGAGCYWGTEHFIRYVFGQKNLQDGRIIDGRVGFMSTNPYLGMNPSSSILPEASSDSDSLLIIPSFTPSISSTPFVPPTYESIKKDNNRNNYIEVFCFKFVGNSEYYKKLIRFFFQFHDPTTKNQQINDKGVKYGSTIFYFNNKQKIVSEKIKKELQTYMIKNNKSSGTTGEDKANLNYKNTFITTRILKKTKFFEAHEGHQEYLTKNEGGYCNHRIRFEEWPIQNEDKEVDDMVEEEEEEVDVSEIKF